jgi:hypothetical protein
MEKGHCCFPLKPGLEQLCVCFGWLRSQGCVSKRFSFFLGTFFGLAYQGKDIVFRFIIEYSSLRDFGP